MYSLLHSRDKLAERSQLACDNSVTGFGVAVCDSDNGTFVLGNYRALHPDSTFFVIDVAAVISFPVCIVHVMEMLIVHISVHMILAELSKSYNTLDFESSLHFRCTTDAQVLYHRPRRH